MYIIIYFTLIIVALRSRGTRKSFGKTLINNIKTFCKAESLPKLAFKFWLSFFKSFLNQYGAVKPTVGSFYVEYGAVKPTVGSFYVEYNRIYRGSIKIPLNIKDVALKR